MFCGVNDFSYSVLLVCRERYLPTSAGAVPTFMAVCERVVRVDNSHILDRRVLEECSSGTHYGPWNVSNI